MVKEIIVRPLTLKGKNRIHEHGACWNIVDSSLTERGVLLESKNTPGYLKWTIPDFEIVEE